MGNSVTCCNDRERDEGAVRRAQLPPEQTFNVVLTKASKDDVLGLNICREEKALQVLGIEKPSLAHDWNSKNPTKKVRENDRVVEVNGVRGTSRKLADLLTTESTLNLAVKRHNVSPNMFDGYWRTGPPSRESVLVRNSKAKFERGSKDMSADDHVWTFDVHDVDSIIAADTQGETYQAVFVEGQLRWDDDDVWVRDFTQYRVDSSGLKPLPPSFRKGIPFCTRQELSAKAPQASVKWGEIIKAHDLENGWVGVHSPQGTYYLPTHVDSVQVLTAVGDTPAQEADAVGSPEATPQA